MQIKLKKTDKHPNNGIKNPLDEMEDDVIIEYINTPYGKCYLAMGICENKLTDEAKHINTDED